MKKLLLPFLVAGFPLLHAEEADLGFQGSLPELSPWKNIGSLKVESVDEAGVKALSFVDESSSEYPLIVCPLDPERVDRMRHEGFTLDVRMKHMLDAGPGGNFSILVGLPGLTPLQISPYGQKDLTLGVFDSETQKSLALQVSGAEEFVDVRAVFRPNPDTGGATCEISAGGGTLTVALAPAENSPRSAIEIGGRGSSSAERTGSTFVESLKLSIP